MSVWIVTDSYLLAALSIMATTNSPSIAFSQGDIDMTTHNDVANFEELFNFEEFESAGESSVSQPYNAFGTLE